MRGQTSRERAKNQPARSVDGVRPRGPAPLSICAKRFRAASLPPPPVVRRRRIRKDARQQWSSAWRDAARTGFGSIINEFYRIERNRRPFAFVLTASAEEDTEIADRVSNRRLKRFGAVAAIGVVVFLAACFGKSRAQGFGGLGQLLGNGGSSGGLGQLFGGGGSSRRQPQQNSGQPAGGVIVQRDVAPFVGRFVGKQKEPSYETNLNAEFACYPARDAALAQTKTFVCYTGEGPPRVPE
jgi:hypothetical protein